MAFAAVLCSASFSRADPGSGVTLHWVRTEGAESCVSGAQLERELGQLLRAGGVASQALVVEGVASRDPATGRFGARMRVLDVDERVLGVRELTSAEARCDQFTPSILLVLSLLVEFAARAQVQAGHPTRDDERVPALRAVVPAKSGEAPSPAPVRLQIDLAPALSVGLNPALSVGPSLGVHLHTAWWPVFALHAGYWPSGRIGLKVSPEADAASMEFHTFTADLGLCLPLVRKAAWWFASCWGAALAVRKTRVRGLDPAASSLRTWAGASSALRLNYAVTQRWSLMLDAGLLAFRQRDLYAYEDVAGQSHTVFRPSHFAGLFALGLGVRP